VEFLLVEEEVPFQQQQELLGELELLELLFLVIVAIL
jgi:hypothetical protein